MEKQQNKLRILLVSQYFYPEVFRINDIAIEWVKRGYDVTVLTGIPNYPQGEFYKGYSKTERTSEIWNGIKIIRLPIEPRKKGSFNLAKNYLSFVLAGRKWIKKTKIEADVVFTYEVSPMTQALVSVWYAKKKHIPHILYVTDLWPENVEIITGIHNRLFIWPIQAMVDYIYKRTSRILTSSKSFIGAIRKRNISESKIEFWPQYAENFYKPVEKSCNSEIPDDGVCNFVFAGNIGFAQGLGILPKAAAKLREEGVIVRFNIIGNGRYMPELLGIIESLKLENYFNFIERKPAEQIPAYLAAADALLITLSKSEVFAITIPAKTQSCLACGKPILVSADGEVQQVINEAHAGLVSNSEDVDGFVRNIKNFIQMEQFKRDELGANALNYSKQHFNKNSLLARMDQIFQQEL
ncbi:glycosyltransferase, group 1 family [Fibrobacter succinogenes subsp. succinogenes S85]|uniref:Glycosyl transferase group 1 n=1 Tax=Fibrobacter succinogenes (strain ATCC 19169 / S85) TaxID=59374 RepID=C9RN15_FIBSS|nr:glycosyltransferase family 4 protein [Fibrobacter succinogenes]ACX76267.1 glycosyl transferase group 1 [Fibrobacter succinogenes subsp. succinogenes S85]ADL27034.1 glycosyltransferase, group 1 family [Fibrobacter succinogenes subsp. succinogenes S85]